MNCRNRLRKSSKIQIKNQHKRPRNKQKYLDHMKKTHNNTKLPFWLLALAVFSRFLPHPPNFTAVGATALYSGRYLNGWTMFLVPLGAMFISDILLGFHSTIFFVYGAFVINILLGLMIAKKPSIARIAGVTVLGSIIFYIITNFGVWLVTPLYSKDFAGLIECYILALPFAKWTLLGDIAYTATMFGVTEIITKKYILKNKLKGEVPCLKPQ